MKITPSQNGVITLSFPGVGKSCPSRQLFYVAYLSLNAIRENKILAKSSELRDCEHISYVSILAVSQNQPILNLFHAHARTQNVLPEGSNSDKVFFNFFFLFDEGREYPNTTKSGPSMARWRADDGPAFNAGLVAL